MHYRKCTVVLSVPVEEQDDDIRVTVSIELPPDYETQKRIVSRFNTAVRKLVVWGTELAGGPIGVQRNEGFMFERETEIVDSPNEYAGFEPPPPQ